MNVALLVITGINLTNRALIVQLLARFNLPPLPDGAVTYSQMISWPFNGEDGQTLVKLIQAAGANAELQDFNLPDEQRYPTKLVDSQKTDALGMSGGKN